MRVPISDLIDFLDHTAPPGYACEWDNVGLQLACANSSIGSVLLAVDVSPEAVETAVELGADLIISHHPLIFRPLKKIDHISPAGAMISSMIKHDISLFVMHTNFDKCAHGTGMALAELMDLKGIKRYSDDPADDMNMVVMGHFEHPFTEGELLNLLRERLCCRSIRLVGDPGSIKTVAVIPGSGNSIIGRIRVPVDLVITGELSYHEALSALYEGRAVALPGHFETEKTGIRNLKNLLLNRFPSLQVNIYGGNGEPFRH